MQLLHPLATVIAKSKLLVLPVYPAAWPQAKRHPLVQLVFKGYETLKCMYVIKRSAFAIGRQRSPPAQWLRGSSVPSASHRR